MVLLDLEGNAISDQEKDAENVTLCQNSLKESRRVNEEQVFRENESKDYDPGTGIQCQVSYQPDSPTGSLDFQSSLWEKFPLIELSEKKVGNTHKGFDDAVESLDGQISDKLSRSFSFGRLQRTLTQKPVLQDGCLCQCRDAEDKFLTRQNKVIANNHKEGTPTSVVHMSNQDDRKDKNVHNQSLRDGSIENCNFKGGHGGFPGNGCFPHKNIANGKSNNTARDTVGEIVLNKHPNGSQVQIVVASPDFKDDWAVRRKGKTAINEDSAQLACGTNSKIQFRRECLESGKVNISSRNKDIIRSTEITGKTRNDSVGKSSINLYSDNACSSQRVEFYELSEESPKIASGFRENIHILHDSPGIVSCLDGSKLNSYGVNSKIETKTGLQNCLQEQVKRKCKSVHSSSVENSVVAKNHSEYSLIETFRQASISKLDETFNSEWNSSVSGSSILVEEQNSQMASSISSREDGCTAYDTFKEAGDQIEKDEILARQLQEEFYYESPIYGGIEEVDENLAWTLQQEEEAHMLSIAREMRYHSRDASMAHLYVHGRHPFQNSYKKATYPARVQSANRRHQQRRNSNNSASNVEMSFLESMESAFDSSNDMAVSNNLLQIHRDFTEDDYEMLMALDENNFQCAGASENQINRLPLSIHKQSGEEVTCAVCLELPSAGEIFRHLPCLHKFHKECIDTWLRRKAVCPVCKSLI